jgi:hypothetical protein
VRRGLRVAIDRSMWRETRRTCASMRTKTLSPADGLDLSGSLADSPTTPSARRLGVVAEFTSPPKSLSRKFHETSQNSASPEERVPSVHCTASRVQNARFCGRLTVDISPAASTPTEFSGGTAQAPVAVPEHAGHGQDRREAGRLLCARAQHASSACGVPWANAGRNVLQHREPCARRACSGLPSGPRGTSGDQSEADLQRLQTAAAREHQLNTAVAKTQIGRGQNTRARGVTTCQTGSVRQGAHFDLG